MAKVYIDGEGVREKYAHLFKGNDEEGRQSMSQVQDLSLYNFAQTFVNIYLEKGSDVAAQYAVENLEKDKVAAAKDYIAMAFEKRGYSIN